MYTFIEYKLYNLNVKGKLTFQEMFSIFNSTVEKSEAR